MDGELQGDNRTIDYLSKKMELIEQCERGFTVAELRDEQVVCGIEYDELHQSEARVPFTGEQHA